MSIRKHLVEYCSYRTKWPFDTIQRFRLTSLETTFWLWRLVKTELYTKCFNAMESPFTNLYKEYLRRAQLMSGLDHAIFLIDIKHFRAWVMHRPWYIKCHALWIFCHTYMSHESKISFLVFMIDIQIYIAYVLNKKLLQKINGNTSSWWYIISVFLKSAESYSQKWHSIIYGK